MRLAAIDIGTNAVRLLLTSVSEGRRRPFFQREAFIRIPIRLGEDVFTRGVISPQKTEQLVKALTGFRHLLDAYGADVPFAGKITSINPAETIVDGVPVYETKVAFAAVDPRIRSGKGGLS